MTTQSTIIDRDWSLIANSADDHFLAQPYGQTLQVEYLATATVPSDGPDEGNIGHRLQPAEQMHRAVIGDGYVWARAWGRSKPGALVVTGSTVDFSESDSES
jgi:hypothetical protein